MSQSSALPYLALAAVAGLGYLVWQQRKSVASAVDPTSRDNVAYQAVNAIGSALSTDGVTGRTADGKWSLGAWLYDFSHPSIAASRDNWNAPKGAAVAANSGGVTGSW